MDVFLTNAQAKFDRKDSKEDSTWLVNLFNIISNNIYKPVAFNKPCEELCLDVLNVILERNESTLPIDHTVLSVSSLYTFEEGKYFTGKFGQKSELSPESAQIGDFNQLEEKPMILVGFLTDAPMSDKSLHSEAGFLYLEDTKNAMLCQLNDKPVGEKYVFNNLVLLSKWNFIDIKFPVYVFESDKVKKSQPNRLKYIEVVESLIWIQKQKSIVIPKALSIEGYFSRKEIMKSKEKINIVGCLKTLCTSYPMSKQKPYFLAKFYSLQDEHHLTIAFWGYKFVSWYFLLKIGETYVISSVIRTTMNKGQPGERKLLAATTHSVFYKVDPDIFMGYENMASDCSTSELQERSQDCTDELTLKRKHDKMDKDVKEVERNVKQCKEKQENSKSCVHNFPNSGVYFCSQPIEYEGIITSVVNSNVGLYEIDNKFRLFTHYMPCKTFGCGMRVGATVVVYNVHLCKLGQKVLGLVCCNSSTIRIGSHSMLDSPFQFWLSNASHIFLLLRHLSLVDFIKSLDLCEHLSKKFQSILSGNYIVGPKTPLHSSKPTIFSHVIDQETMVSPSPRNLFDEFFSDPHCCIVTMPQNKITVPTTLPLKDLLSLVDQLDEQQLSGSAKGQYGWNYQEITQKDLPENLVLLGWLSPGKENCQWYFCDSTSSIPCLITESEMSETNHKCDAGCIVKRYNANIPVLPHTDEIKPNCPLPQTIHFQAILKLTSFRFIIETFTGVETAIDKEPKSKNPLRKIYLVFSACHGIIIGKIPGPSVASEKQKRDHTATKGGEKEKNSDSMCRFVFLVKHKELEMVKGSSLTACVHGYILGKYELGSQTEKESILGSTGNKYNDFQSIKGDLESQGVEDIKTVTKQELIIEFTNNCYRLNMLHPGRFYSIGELKHLNNVCQIEQGLGRIAVVHTSSNIRLEEIDTVLDLCDAYKEWSLLAEQFGKINSVRSCLSNWELRKHVKKFESKDFLVSFRGIILTRDTVVSNDNQCPFPSVPSGHVYVPRYGLISRAQASAFALGYCYLGNRSVVLTIRDVLTADSVKLYLDFSGRPYPFGLLPGAVVKFRHLHQHISKQGNIYATLEACSSISIEALPPTITPTRRTANSVEQNNLIEQRRIIEYFNFQRCGKVFCTLGYILCHLVAVQKISLKWTCSKCGRLPSNCYCHVSKVDQSWIFSAQARCIVEDGTGEAMVFIDDDKVVRQMLFVKESPWLELKNMIRKYGEVLYQRSAYWKNGKSGGDSKADQTLSSMVSSNKLYRRIKILCRQFQMASNQERESRRESRTIRVDQNEHATEISAKITLNVLEIHEMKYKDEIRTLIAR